MFNHNMKKRVSDRPFVPLSVAFALVVGVVCALSYVWLDVRCEALGERIKELERERAEIQKRYDNELWKWARATSPSSIEASLRRHDLEMVWPDEVSIVRLQNTEIADASLQELAGQVARLAQPPQPSVTSSAHD